MSDGLPVRLLVGLGNPGSEYEGTRHNFGFMAVDEVVRRHNFSPWRNKFHGQVCEGRVLGVPDRLYTLKPMTFMNLSGQSVEAAAAFYKLAPEQIVVFHDDLDLPSGKVKVKKGGGHAGHNGLRSIDAHIGAEYWRVRLGIGRPDNKALVHDYVLHNFAKADAAWKENLLLAIAEALPLLLSQDQARFMNEIAAKTGE